MFSSTSIIAIGFILFVRTFIASPFQMNGSSMEPNFHHGQYMLAEKLDREFEHGDIVILTPKVDSTREYYIKRIIGLPGETIRFSSGEVFIQYAGMNDFSKLDESFLSEINHGQTYLPDYIEQSEFVIPADSYWLMGDNRNNSADSRSCFRNCFGEDISKHFIKKSQIIGKIIK